MTPTQNIWWAGQRRKAELHESPAERFPWSPDWRNFTPGELACKGTGFVFVEPTFMDKLQILRDAWGRPLRVTSGYRTPGHNRAVGGASRSMHQLGIAADLGVQADEVASLARLAIKQGFGGVKAYSTWVHVDTRPWVWREV